jgi:hypothetical protein
MFARTDMYLSCSLRDLLYKKRMERQRAPARGDYTAEKPPEEVPPPPPFTFREVKLHGSLRCCGAGNSFPVKIKGAPALEIVDASLCFGPASVDQRLTRPDVYCPEAQTFPVEDLIHYH